MPTWHFDKYTFLDNRNYSRKRKWSLIGRKGYFKAALNYFVTLDSSFHPEPKKKHFKKLQDFSRRHLNDFYSLTKLLLQMSKNL
jgi:hypothetical protein